MKKVSLLFIFLVLNAFTVSCQPKHSESKKITNKLTRILSSDSTLSNDVNLLKFNLSKLAKLDQDYSNTDPVAAIIKHNSINAIDASSDIYAKYTQKFITSMLRDSITHTLIESEDTSAFDETYVDNYINKLVTPSLRISVIKSIKNELANDPNIFDSDLQLLAQEFVSDKYDFTSHLIDSLLIRIFKNPSIQSYDLSQILKHRSLSITHSPDYQFWITTWPQLKTGTASYTYNLNFVTKANGSTSVIKENAVTGEKIYTLKSTNKNFYLILDRSSGCSSCRWFSARVVELVNDNLNLDYPCFETSLEERRLGKPTSEGTIEPVGKYGSEFGFDSRIDDCKQFKFDELTQTLKFIYMTDDLTPIKTSRQAKPRLISRQLRFDGSRFIGNGYQ